MALYEPFALIALGVLTGVYGVIIGAGGGFILGPVLILIWGLEPAVAVGTSLAVVFTTSVSGSLAYGRSRSIDYRSGVLFALAALPGSVVGALAVANSPSALVLVSFGALLLLTSSYMTLSRRAREKPLREPAQARAPRFTATRTITTAGGETHTYSFNEPAAVGVNVFFGLVSSFFGIGGGLLRMPLLVYAFRFPVGIAAATSIFAMSLYTGVGVVSHAVLGDVEPLVLLFSAIGVIFGAQVGARLARRVRQGVVVTLLAVGLGIAGVWLVLTGVDVV